MSPRKCSAKQLEALRKGREKRKKNLDAAGKGKTCKGKKGSCKTKGSYAELLKKVTSIPNIWAKVHKTAVIK